MAKQQLRIGTRASQLALWQANWVKSELEKRYPDMEVTLTKIKTQGDKILDVPLAMVGGADAVGRQGRTAPTRV